MRMEDIPGSQSGPLKGDYRHIELKPDHSKRPLWVCADGHIFFEPAAPSLFERATEFLISIAEPVSRPHYIHEYCLTEFSLHTAASIGQDRGLSRENIIKTLEEFAKNLRLPKEVVEFINKSTAQYGRAKIIIKNKKYFMETSDRLTLEQLLANSALIKSEYDKYMSALEKAPPEQMKEKPKADLNNVQMVDGPNGAYYLVGEQEEDIEIDEHEEKEEHYEFEVQKTNVEEVKRQCRDNLHIPLIEEYEFGNDKVLPDLMIDLSQSTQIRPYQEQSLSKMLSSGRARSGIIVLPCGAGKTLVGISAICTVKKPAIIFCNSTVAVEQWMEQIKLWTNAEEKGIKIVRFTAKGAGKDPMFKEGEAGIIIGTYSMMSYNGKRSEGAQQMLSVMKNREWGLLLADEVQVVPAKGFRTIMSECRAHAKLGLTATLVREDNRIDELGYLIGPKLYEANWQQLQSQGYIAKVQCSEVWCQMTPEFYMKYLEVPGRRKESLYVANPNKYIACQYLITKHEGRGDKIIVFSDNLFVLKQYSARLKKQFIFGGTRNDVIPSL
eukprot:TRINITY_DN2888_c0_g3_i5.p1 TRINITY_DN2888_c0_g3~~TRINITY_DN2888_c0_g3_i5.p1  ORF type:complete len:616 (-),score=205.73 TRINITY_DN2888_c0_g3_i5:609-2264(-)